MTVDLLAEINCLPLICVNNHCVTMKFVEEYVYPYRPQAMVNESHRICLRRISRGLHFICVFTGLPKFQAYKNKSVLGVMDE